MDNGLDSYTPQTSPKPAGPPPHGSAPASGAERALSSALVSGTRPEATAPPVRGLSAFPLTPLHDDRLDETAFSALVERLADADVDSIAVLGSTGSYAYLTAGERARVAQLACRHAGSTPVIIGIGALRTSQVLENLAAAEAAGAAAVLLAPMTYQPLTEDEVAGLFAEVCERSGLPVIVYDNPGTTRVDFSLRLYARIAAMPQVVSIKIPPLPTESTAASAQLAAIRAAVPADVTIGISGDASAATALSAGCDAWYSVIAGTLPQLAWPIIRAIQAGDDSGADAESARLTPLWHLFAEHGSLRVTAAIAEHLGLVQPGCLPLPIRGLSAAQRRALCGVLDEIGIS